MAKFSIHDLALAMFRGCPDWPVRIIEVLNPKTANSKSEVLKYLVFCYGSHDTQFVLKSPLMQFEANNAEAMKSTSKGVNGALENFIHLPNIYVELCKEKLRTQIPIPGQQAIAGPSAIVICMSVTQQKIQSVMENLATKIDEKLDEKLVATAPGRQSLFSDTLNVIKAQSSTIVSEVYSALIVEFEPKFLALSNELKFLRNQIIFLEEIVKNAE